ncbi:MAG: bifunctional phosphopantothenoylcysteine decarboxylase/phosphopantothenate--cysteine ligase CoaBC [Bdellovibrionia bacterium]
MDPWVQDHLRASLTGKKILLGITGSIAAFKACDVIRFLRACGAQVRVVLSEGAENFVTATTLETLSDEPVNQSFWVQPHQLGSPIRHGTHHIATARWADLILVAPATAHFLAKAALGLADDLLCTELLAFSGPLLVVPAMNPTMFQHPAVQQNVRTLEQRGVEILGPTWGATSCGEEGLGRMLEPDRIVEEVAQTFYQKPTGKKLLISLGPTQSRLDPVRFLSNRSSGKMGASLCWAAREAGFQVTAICGPLSSKLPQSTGPGSALEIIHVETAQAMSEAVLSHWSHSDAYLGAAAVLDWEFKNPSSQKLKKEDGPPRVEFQKTRDLLAEVCLRKAPHQWVLGFAAETDHPLEHGRSKLKRKNCDALFVNDVSQEGLGFDSTQNAGWWMEPSGRCEEISARPKSEVARWIIREVTQALKVLCSPSPPSDNQGL